MLPLTKLAHPADFKDQSFIEVCNRYQLPLVKSRKTWEMAMALLSLDQLNKVNGCELLGVGVAKETTIACLSQFAKRIFATDLYIDNDEWGGWIPNDLLKSPEKYFPSFFNKRRVVFQHVDGRNLPYEDESFDAIFSCSSIEHFGRGRDIKQAIREIYRVLKPSGIAAISTEFKLKGTGEGFANVQLFDEARLLEYIGQDKLLWGIVDADFEDPPLTEVPVDFNRLVVDKSYAEAHSDHLILQTPEYTWTSIHLTLKKISSEGELDTELPERRPL